jgi:hypothetical protein
MKQPDVIFPQPSPSNLRLNGNNNKRWVSLTGALDEDDDKMPCTVCAI